MYSGVGDGRERAADFGISAVQVADDKFRDAVFVIRLIATAKKAPTEIAEENYGVEPTDAEGMKKLGLPCYATPEQCAVLHEKIAFKELCDSVGFARSQKDRS